MKFILGCIPVAYLISQFTLTAPWNNAIEHIAIRFDLPPEQLILIPMGFNLAAAAFGIPSLIEFVKLIKSKEHSSGAFKFSLVCSLAVIILILGTIRWVVSEPAEVASGLKSAFDSDLGRENDSATISDGIYRDNAIGFKVKLPQTWEVLSSNAIKRAHSNGIRAMSSASASSLPTELPEGVEQFLVIKKFPETHQGYNPSILFMSYEKMAMRRSGTPTIDDLISPIARNTVVHTCLNGPSTLKIGNSEFIEIQLKLNYANTSIRQNIYAIELPAHYITITTSFEEKHDYEVMKRALKSIEVE